MGITRHGLDTELVHFEPTLCIPDDVRPMLWTDLVRTAHQIEWVTCEACKHYYYHPEERGTARRWWRNE